MMAAIQAGKAGHQVHVYEKNEKFGKKIYITGKGRCNVTNHCDVEELLGNVVRNSKFLYSACYGFTSEDMMELLEEAGCPLKVERGNRVFPTSDHSSDVIAALVRLMKENGVFLHLNARVEGILTQDGKVEGIRLGDGSRVEADRVIVATGGLSYPTTGSTGDGYGFARDTGHVVTETLPSLVPFQVKEGWVQELQGLSLRNVELRILDGRKEIYREFGEMLFTHFGVSGPLVLSGSSYVGEHLLRGKVGEIKLVVDLKPALSKEQLDARLLREFAAHPNKSVRNVIPSLLPTKLHDVFLRYCRLDGDRKVNEITREERQTMLEALKGLEMTFAGLRDYKEAIITKGGVKVSEVNPSTMESKRCKGLYFAGEVLDLDALTGGYNLQIAWSTGYLAGTAQ